MGYCYGLGAYGSSFLGNYWWIMPLIFWGLIITGIVVLFKAFKNSGSRRALDILKEEYALGNISREEFLERKKDLQ